MCMRLQYAAAIVVLSLLPSTLVAETGRPNFLIIMADDCTFNELPLYGGKNANTPNIDRLAKRGLTFNQAYLASSMCQPCRAELFTGQYPLSNGCSWNHSASRPSTKSLPHLLRPLGYRVGIAGKVHVRPAAVFPFDKVAGFDPSCVRDPTRAHELSSVRNYISAKEHEDPFCLVIALVEPHIPWVMGDASQYPPKKLKLPPNIADTPLTRQHFSDYLAEITYMDGQVGQILDALVQSGAADDTVVLFTSEQGSQFPGCRDGSQKENGRTPSFSMQTSRRLWSHWPAAKRRPRSTEPVLRRCCMAKRTRTVSLLTACTTIFPKAPDIPSDRSPMASRGISAISCQANFTLKSI